MVLNKDFIPKFTQGKNLIRRLGAPLKKSGAK